jgi:hypothetical protein
MNPLPRTRRVGRLIAACVATWLVVAGASTSAQATREDLTIYVNEITTWTPGYPMGDIVLGSPATAGYEPTNARRQLMLRGKKPGRTTLSVWDQKKVLRHEITLIVTTREAETIEADLKALLAPYPNVQIARLGGNLMLTGTVATSADLAAVNNIARVAKAQTAVTLVAPATPGNIRSATPGAATPGTVATTPGAAATPAATGPTVVEYELELFEASTQFKTGDYGRGVEPSGRSLYKGTVRAAVGEEGTLFIGGAAMDPKAAQNAKNKKQPAASTQETGIRLTVRPQPGRSGLVTGVEVETNVPISHDLYDPDVWRRSRYSFTTVEGVPFAVSGNDLLAAPSAVDRRGNPIGTVSSKAGTASRLPGPQRTGLQYVPVFGSLFGSNSYKAKTTQLLVVFRPTLTTGEPQP